MTTLISSKPDGSLAFVVNGTEAQVIDNTSFSSTFYYNIATSSNSNIGVGINPPGGARVYIAGGNSTIAPLDFQGGAVQTTPLAGSVEYDGNVFYTTANTTVGRGVLPSVQTYRITSNATNITATATGTSFFGSGTNIPLANSGVYEIEYDLFYRKTTATTVIFRLEFDNTPTVWTIQYQMSPITGAVAPPGTATTLAGQVPLQTVNNYVITTGSITTGINIWTNIKLFVVGSATTSNLKLFSYNGAAGTITPLAGSYWKATRLPDTNNGTYIT